MEDEIGLSTIKTYSYIPPLMSLTIY